MKLSVVDDKIIIYCNKKIDYEKIDLDKYFEELLIKIKNKYNIKLNGYYTIVVHIDKIYGSIIEIVEDNFDCYDYFNQVDMEIKLKKEQFLYELDYEYFNKKIMNETIIYDNKLYLKIDDKKSLDSILEFCKIIYGNDIKKILFCGKKVNL